MREFTLEQQMTGPAWRGFRIVSDKRALSDILLGKDKSGGFDRKVRDKAPLRVRLGHRPFAPADALDPETPAAEPPAEALTPCANGPRAGAKSRVLRPITNSYSKGFRPGRGRRTSQPSAPSRLGAAFRAGAGLALLDALCAMIRPLPGRCASAWPCAPPPPAPHWRAFAKILPRCATPNIFPPAGAHTSPAGRMHRFWRDFSGRPVELDATTLRRAADLLELPHDLDLEGLAEALRQTRNAQTIRSPLRRRPAPPAMKLFCDASPAGADVSRAGNNPHADVSRAGNRPHAEIWAFWLSDLMLAHRLGWESPLPMLATVIAHPSLRRGGAGRRPRPGEPEWAQAVACGYALAASQAFALAAELSRRSEKLLAVAPKLRAKGAERVIELLLSDDVISPASASKLARLSDRAARRLFDRLIELDAVRELSGRPNFRLYGL